MSKSNKKNILVLGGGLAGLSTAYHLKSQPYLLIEREGRLGGTARSTTIDGFTFDFTGHLLHLHNPYTKKLISRLLKNNFFVCHRRAAIHSHNVTTPYPYQANLYGLPQTVVDECLVKFIENYFDRSRKPALAAQLNFEQWCHQAFGAGISKYFMIPYNEKLYQVPAKSMSTEWCGPFVPTPSLEEVVRGAFGEQKQEFGYNTTFLYPKNGGIQVLAENLSKSLKNIRLNTSIASVDWKKKVATLSDGRLVPYSHLVNTVPLAEFLKRLKNLPSPIKRAQKQLKCVGILCLNLGVKRAKISDKSWVYFPEKRYPFYRVGFPMNFTPHVVPRGCSSMYVEVPLDLNKPYNPKKILSDVRSGLIHAGILKPSDKIPVAQFIPIRYAYVIYNKERIKALKTIFSFFARHQIQSIGRYGAWKYSFMEEAILDGKKAAENILARAK